MDFKKLADRAKKTIDERGGVESLKADAEQLKKVAQGKGSLTDKAKAAAQAIKEPGDRREAKAAQHAGNPEDTPRKGGPPHQ